MIQIQGHSAAGRMMSMKISSDTMGNRTRELPVCSSVPQPTAPHFRINNCKKKKTAVNIHTFLTSLVITFRLWISYVRWIMLCDSRARTSIRNWPLTVKRKDDYFTEISRATGVKKNKLKTLTKYYVTNGDGILDQLSHRQLLKNC
jgi:hypothetical protein